jgi:hypothetical protein
MTAGTDSGLTSSGAARRSPTAGSEVLATERSSADRVPSAADGNALVDAYQQRRDTLSRMPGPGLLLVRRREVDLGRVASACCPRTPANG